ncbi:MAG: enoyl-CoA hydratase/isomerase family protein, partial [Planctomycetota bacterium]|jgi:naphthoate synthase
VGDRRAREILFLNEEIPMEKALDWGLVNQVVPREQLDGTVEVWVAKLLDKFPEKTRYTKQQLNFWRDLSWHLTIGHGRDWLSIHNTSPETWEGVLSFSQKREPDYDAIRRRWSQDESPEWPGGRVPPVPDSG